MAEGWHGYLGAWEDFRVVADEYRELDAERVFVLIHRSGHGRTSGLGVDDGVESSGPVPHRRRQGDTARPLLGRERALADLGLGPETGSPGS
jgi:hypothetical protein